MTVREKKEKEDNKNSDSKRSFTVREMEIQDLADAYNLGETCFRADLWPMLYRGWDEYEVTSMFNTDGDYCLVAENDEFQKGIDPDDERIVGFVLGTVMSKPGTAWSYGYIVWLCAHPNWQREGVASKLIDKVVEAFVENEGVRIIMADTDPSNNRAVHFFKKKGFDQEHQHVFLTSNIENNPLYSNLLHKSRAAALEEQYLKKIRRLAIGSSSIAAVKNLKRKNINSKNDKGKNNIAKKKSKKKK
ncbi:MAG: N-acetyltransferase [Spirobacillus cienkowskii]|jgi:ribosomal protein S18 acetylase RimI-like enzyme|uniref:N-acetyltransferase n=1 Tax=Spirobacillus cienkowskii TaxID=495820 RepID=A0A369KT66_9BACT|nr:MAG: N-acetyltransferase [Spirobacillus cienkowskii]